MGDARKDTRCAVDAEQVITPVLTVKTISVSMIFSGPLMLLRDWWIESSANAWIWRKRMAHFLEIVAKNTGNRTIEYHIRNTPYHNDRGIVCTSDVYVWVQ